MKLHADDPLDSPQPARVPVRQVVLSIVGLWTCYFVLITMRSSIVGLDFFDDLLWRRALVCLAGTIATGILWLLLRFFDRRPLWIQVVAALVLAMPAAIFIAQANQLVFAPVQEKVESKIAEERGFKLRRDESGNLVIEAPTEPAPDADGVLGPDSGATARVVLPNSSAENEKWTGLVELALGRYFLLLAWSALYLAILAGTQARAAERRAGEFREAARAAELRSLRYQVNPHFLFNSLNSLSALVMTGKAERAEAMIQTLSNFYRHSLAEDTTSDVDLADEFALQQHYLAIEAIRFPERLKTQFELPQALETVRIPGMILQPLVENSVKYAVAPLTRPVLIHIAAHEDAGDLVITVTDDGPGVHDLAGHGFGIGLANVRDRLKARYGGAARITAGPIKDGYRTQIRIPMRQQGHAD